jgi:MarR family transcriptional regulator, organic hydroperoxide resistance regulator
LGTPVVGNLKEMSDSFVPGLRYRSPAQQLWALIVECTATCEARMAEAAAEAGLSPVSAWTLVRLDPEVPISQKELAGRLRCSPSTVVDPTDRLEERGLVVRQTHPDDRRIKVLLVTEEGTRLRDRLMARLFEPPEPLDRLPVEDQRRFRDVMLELVAPGQLWRGRRA